MWLLKWTATNGTHNCLLDTPSSVSVCWALSRVSNNIFLNICYVIYDYILITYTHVSVYPVGQCVEMVINLPSRAKIDSHLQPQIHVDSVIY